MTAERSRQYWLPAIVASTVGILLCWFMNEPFGLLAPVAAIYLYLPGRAVWWLRAAWIIALLGSVVGATSVASGEQDRILQWTAFFALALCIGEIIEIKVSTIFGADALEAMLIVGSMPAYTWSASPDGHATYVSAGTFAYTGLQPATSGLFHLLDNAAWRQIIHPDDYSGLMDKRRESLALSIPFDTELRIRRHDGVYRWFRLYGSLSRDHKGRQAGWYGTMIDIEERKVAEQTLQHNKRQLQQLTDAVPAAIWSTASDGTPTYVNKRFMQMTGATIADVTAHDGSLRLDIILHPDDAEGAMAAFKRSRDTGEPYVRRYRQIRANGAYHWTETRAEPLRDQSGTIINWYGQSIDIHDQVIAQHALEQSERQLQLLVDAVPAMIWSTTPEGQPVFVNKRFMDVTGTTLEDATGPDGMPTFCTIHPDYRADARSAFMDAFATGVPCMMRYPQLRSDGSHRWSEVRVEPSRGENDEVLQWYAVCVDIDDQVQAHEALLQSERSLRQLVETLPAMIDCATPDGEPIYRSKQLREFLGYDLDLLDGEPSRLDATLDAGVHPNDLQGVKERYAHSLATGEPYARRHRLRRFDGEYRWVETRAGPMRDAAGAIVQWNVICLDIDGEMRAQEELRQAQEKLARASQAASLAELSASIAHEVNQPLAAIVANSHACQRWLTASPPNIERAHRTVERVIRDANGAADVVSRIRALFRQSGEKRNMSELRHVIAEVCDLIAEEAARRHTRIAIDVESEVPPVAIDRVQIQQVLTNLIRNGIDAMDAAAGDKVIHVRVSCENDDTVEISVSDLGSGVEFPEKVFQPFFSTKEQGMGMGLSICRSIIDAHGGNLWVENKSQGATFAFSLPVRSRTFA
ncbi:PAS domain-containing protein [Tardiphaga robiniae]|uniref:PAS domain-containing protein n=2 Tax=Tardiphaga TaxID=1395974 RepID=UPI001586BA8E|nr:PAS domain-containing protein [Tardiphaga robiniae]NUU44636.1 PAS domain-containing protein [Tardiphaga robiniae]